jgi:hypothetical protein
MFRLKQRFYFNGWVFILIIIVLGFLMVKIVLAQDDIWIPPTQNGVCNGTQTCFCSGKAVDCPCDADPCKICGPTSPECAQANPGQTNPEEPTVPENTGQYTPVQPAVPKKIYNNTTEELTCLQLLSNGFLLNTFDSAWWSKILACFAANDFDPAWSAFVNDTFYPTWFAFINFQFITDISHNSCWGMRCCTTPVINGSYHKCSDCNKAFEPTAITGPYPYKGYCNVGKVNRYDASLCQIIDCKK